jgi:hypothetical protein
LSMDKLKKYEHINDTPVVNDKAIINVVVFIYKSYNVFNMIIILGQG